MEVPCPALAANSARDTAWKDLHDHELAQKDDDSMCSRERSLLATRVALQLECSSPRAAAPTATTFCRRFAVCAKAPKLFDGQASGTPVSHGCRAFQIAIALPLVMIPLSRPETSRARRRKARPQVCWVAVPGTGTQRPMVGPMFLVALCTFGQRIPP